jgi:hypothetical protein
MKLIKLDAMSPSISFKVNKNDSFKSVIGLILTLVYISLIILAFIAFGRDIFEKRNPRVTYNKQILENSFYKLTSENMVITVYQQADHKEILEFDRKFVIYLDVFLNYPGGYDTYTYGFSKCTDSVLEAFKGTLKVDKSRYYCLANNLDLTMTGSREQDIFWSSRLNIDYCEVGKANKTDCLKLDQIKQNLGVINMDFNLFDYYPDSFNYTHPLKETFYKGFASSTVDTFQE